jgi:ribosomal protein S12 methylthiotransferase
MHIKSKDKVSVITLGCAKNTVDSERLVRQLQLNDIDVRINPAEADSVIINTCGFIEAAKEESVNTILNAVANKKEGKLKKVFVSGCLSARYKEDLIKEIPEVDFYFGTEDYQNILKTFGGELKYNLLGERAFSSPSHSAYLKISEGCDHPCSFCAIPIMRGLHKSKPVEDLLRETEFLASNGTKELVIIAQDTTDYGKDIYGKRNLAELMNTLSEVNGIEWIRLMYAYPSHFPEEVISVISQNPKVCKYIDIPLQHISDNVLKSMRRGTTGRQIRELLYKLRERIPDLVLRTTFIVGYPEESDRNFKELCDFVEEIKFERIGAFTYSLEENTYAFNLGDPVKAEIKNSRKDTLMEIQKDISLGKNSLLVGKKLKTLIDGVEGDYHIGRSYRDAPEVDGEILISAENKKIIAGGFYDVEVYEYNEYDLFARVI